ncbi:protein kinase domain-containing protein [Haliangium sp.]|uniref:serine/threonine-protein kinase n=1 Tax=Haliangium sp. TaxID=2663208 RepID=UPI003D1503C3
MTESTPSSAGADLGDALTRARVEAALFDEPLVTVKVGRFSLLEQIGAGSMGEVYAAYDPELDRKVAIKLVRPDAAGPAATDRLYREAQTLARLSHPNVVHIYEVGRGHGRVWLAMEFVRGVTLRDWLDQRRRGWREILRVFIAAGRGIAAAHAAGLMHRDVKPSNVVCGDDGRVRVIDFGLARVDVAEKSAAEPAASTPTGAATVLTRPGTLAGTPAYMSPEQISGGAVDRRSDQWSFCVALYEALYGVRPFTGDDLRSLRESIARGELPTPRRAAVPHRVRRALARGLSVEPAQRHASMDALLNALAPAAATRWPWSLTLLLGAVALTVGFGLWGAADTPCDAAGRQLVEVWDDGARARLRSAITAAPAPYAAATWRTVEAGIDRYVDELAGEYVDACEATHVRAVNTVELYELRSLCLDRRVARLQAVIDRLGRADSDVEHAVTSVAALPPIDTCADGEQLKLGMRPPDDPAVAVRVAAIRDRLAAGHAFEHAGRYDEAIRIADEQIAASERTGYAPVRAEALWLAGVSRLDRDRDDDGARGRALLLAAADAAEGSRHDELAVQVWNALSGTRVLSSDDTSQLGLFMARAWSAVERLGDRGPHLARASSNRGTLAFLDKRYRDAEVDQREAVALAERRGLDPLTAASYRQDLANTLTALGENDQARALYERALSDLRGALGATHPRVARADYDLARFLTQQGEFASARVHLSDAARAWTMLDAERGIDMGRVHLALADIDHQTGALDRAAAHAAQGLESYREHYGADHPKLIEPLVALGVIHHRRGAFADAVRVTERALAVASAAPGADDDPNLGIIGNNLGEALVELGRYREALARFTEAERIFARTKIEHPLLLALPDKGRGLALLGMGRPNAALAPLERALSRLRAHPGAPLEHADTAWALARALRAAGRGPAQRARALALEAQRLYATLGDDTVAQRDAIGRWLGGELDD